MSIEWAYNRFCTERFPLPSEADVEELEQRISVNFPPEYRDFLLQYNGGYFSEPDIVPPPDAEDECPEDALTFLHGIRATHPYAELGHDSDLTLFEDNDPPQVVPVGYTLMGGLLLLIVHYDGYGRIVLKKASGRSYWLADTINEFFELLQPASDD